MHLFVFIFLSCCTYVSKVAEPSRLKQTVYMEQNWPVIKSVFEPEMDSGKLCFQHVHIEFQSLIVANIVCFLNILLLFIYEHGIIQSDNLQYKINLLIRLNI